MKVTVAQDTFDPRQFCGPVFCYDETRQEYTLQKNLDLVHI